MHPFSGPVFGGTSVTIVGHGLQLGGLGCRFGGTPARASRQSAYRVRCLAPRHVATGCVELPSTPPPAVPPCPRYSLNNVQWACACGRWVSLELTAYGGTAESASAFYYQVHPLILRTLILSMGHSYLRPGPNMIFSDRDGVHIVLPAVARRRHCGRHRQPQRRQRYSNE